MAFEKIRTMEEMQEITNTLKTMKLNEQEKKALVLILSQTGKINKYLGEEGIKEYEEIIMKGENLDMKNFDEFMDRICDENYEKGIKRGIKQVVMNMLKKKMQDKDIIEITNITQEELNKLKLQIG